MRRTIAQSALVFASVLLIIALAGCGGGSKKTTTGGMMPDPDPDPMPDPGTAITGLPAGHTLESGTIAAGASQTILAYSKGRSATISCPPGGAACVVTVADDGTARATGATPTVRVTTNELVWQANNGPAGSSDGAHAVGILKRLDARATSVGTSALPYPQGPPPVPPTGFDGGNAQTTLTAVPTITPSMTWTRGTSPMLGLTLGSEAFSGLDSGSLPMNSGKLSVDKDSALPSLGRGWNGVALSKDLSEVNGRTIRGVVYTNAAKPTGEGVTDTPARTFAEGFDLSGHSDLNTLLGASSAITSPQELTIEGFKVTIDASDITALRTGAPQSRLLVDVEYDDSGTTRTREDVELRCTVLTCRYFGGSLQGTWTLSNPVRLGMGGTQDTDYQVLGSWLVLPNTNTDATDSYNLGVFHFTASGVADGLLTAAQLDGNAGAASGSNQGKITFKGPATGIYTTGTRSGSGATRTVTAAEVDAFTAAATLVGTFGTTAVVSDDSFTGVIGTVNNFMDSSGESLPWTMSLKQTTGHDTDTTELFTGTTALETTSGQSLTGDWGVQFYWNNQRTPTPGLGFAGGTFDASTATSEDNLLHVVGAFAAERQ